MPEWLTWILIGLGIVVLGAAQAVWLTITNDVMNGRDLGRHLERREPRRRR